MRLCPLGRAMTCLTSCQLKMGHSETDSIMSPANLRICLLVSSFSFNVVFAEVGCPAGQVSQVINATEQCQTCGVGAYVPAGAQGTCVMYQCDPGTVDHDSSPETPCVECGPGAYAPEGAFGSCYSHQCVLGTTDHDYSSTTPCQLCAAGKFGARGSVG